MADNKKEVLMHELKTDLGELRHLISKLLDAELAKDRAEEAPPQDKIGPWCKDVDKTNKDEKIG